MPRQKLRHVRQLALSDGLTLGSMFGSSMASPVLAARFPKRDFLGALRSLAADLHLTPATMFGACHLAAGNAIIGIVRSLLVVPSAKRERHHRRPTIQEHQCQQ